MDYEDGHVAGRLVVRVVDATDPRTWVVLADRELPGGGITRPVFWQWVSGSSRWGCGRGSDRGEEEVDFRALPSCPPEAGKEVRPSLWLRAGASAV